jgi:4-amino-4-deoxy-L-arabinose transferase-like glycosyltransferase
VFVAFDRRLGPVVLSVVVALCCLGYARVTLDRDGPFAIIAVGVCGICAIVWAWWTET